MELLLAVLVVIDHLGEAAGGAAAFWDADLLLGGVPLGQGEDADGDQLAVDLLHDDGVLGELAAEGLSVPAGELAGPHVEKLARFSPSTWSVWPRAAWPSSRMQRW